MGMKKLILSVIFTAQLMAGDRIPIPFWLSFTNAVQGTFTIKTNDIFVSSTTYGLPFQDGEVWFWVDLPQTNTIYTVHRSIILFKDMTQINNPDIYPSEFPNPDYHIVTNYPMTYFRFTRSFAHADDFICYSGATAYTTNTSGVPFWTFARMPCRFHRNNPNGIAPPRLSNAIPIPAATSGFHVISTDPLDELLKIVPD
jgi:hypothetical protein